jgi:hypothetical protein
VSYKGWGFIAEHVGKTKHRVDSTSRIGQDHQISLIKRLKVVVDLKTITQIQLWSSGDELNQEQVGSQKSTEIVDPHPPIDITTGK